MNEDVRTLREFDKAVARCYAAGYDNRSVRHVKPEGECRYNWWVIDKGGRNLDVLILHNWPRVGDFVRKNHGGKVWSSFVGDSNIDVVCVHFKEESGHFFSEEVARKNRFDL